MKHDMAPPEDLPIPHEAVDKDAALSMEIDPASSTTVSAGKPTSFISADC